MRVCRYCDSSSIGYEKDSYDGDFGVCKACAHINTTVYLWDGGTYRKKGRSDVPSEEENHQ